MTDKQLRRAAIAVVVTMFLIALVFGFVGRAQPPNTIQYRDGTGGVQSFRPDVNEQLRAVANERLKLAEERVDIERARSRLELERQQGDLEAAKVVGETPAEAIVQVGDKARDWLASLALLLGIPSLLLSGKLFSDFLRGWVQTVKSMAQHFWPGAHKVHKGVAIGANLVLGAGLGIALFAVGGDLVKDLLPPSFVDFPWWVGGLAFGLLSAWRADGGYQEAKQMAKKSAPVIPVTVNPTIPPTETRQPETTPPSTKVTVGIPPTEVR